MIDIQIEAKRYAPRFLCRTPPSTYEFRQDLRRRFYRISDKNAQDIAVRAEHQAVNMALRFFRGAPNPEPLKEWKR